MTSISCKYSQLIRRLQRLAISNS